MPVAEVREYLKQWGKDGGVREFPVSSATVELAARAVGVVPARIAKTIALRSPDGCLLVVAAGDAKVDNARFKARFGHKARMLDPDETLAFTGHAVGGVCPFAISRKDVTAYLDESLRRFDSVFPACGSGNSAIELTCDELFACAKAAEWVDVCKDWRG